MRGEISANTRTEVGVLWKIPFSKPKVTGPAYRCRIQHNPGATENRLFRWEDQKNAVISGIEGNFSTPLGESVAFNTNFTKMIKSEDESGHGNRPAAAAVDPR